MWRRKNPHAHFDGNGTATKANSMEVPQNKKPNYHMIQQTHYRGINPEEFKSRIQRYICPCVHCSIIHSSQDMEAIQININR